MQRLCNQSGGHVSSEVCNQSRGRVCRVMCVCVCVSRGYAISQGHVFVQSYAVSQGVMWAVSMMLWLVEWLIDGGDEWVGLVMVEVGGVCLVMVEMSGFA